MCRILALTRNTPRPLLHNLLLQFRLLARYGRVTPGSKPGHRDGWGIVSYKNGNIIHHIKKPADALKDTSYEKMIGEIRAHKPEFSIVHLRKGSVGKNKTHNTHPFLLDNWSLCHNGHIHNSETIPLSKAMHSRIKGTSDTERFFLSLMDSLKEKPNHPKQIRAGIIRTIHAIQKNHDYLALNALFSNGKILWAIREVNEKNTDIREKHAIPYFSLYVARNYRGEITALCSEKLSLKKSTWRPLPNHTLLEINIQTQKERSYFLSIKP